MKNFYFYIGLLASCGNYTVEAMEKTAEEMAPPIVTIAPNGDVIIDISALKAASQTSSLTNEVGSQLPFPGSQNTINSNSSQATRHLHTDDSQKLKTLADIKPNKFFTYPPSEFLFLLSKLFTGKPIPQDKEMEELPYLKNELKSHFDPYELPYDDESEPNP